MLSINNISTEHKNVSGVYKIISIDNKLYIGSTKCIYTRLRNHYSLLKRNKHHSNYLQNSYNKDNNFNIEILEVCDISELIEREQYYIDSLKPEYNMSPIAGTTLGRVTRQETKEKISKSLMGHIGANRGGKLTNEAKSKISLANSGKKRTNITKEKLSLLSKERWRLNPNQNKKVNEDEFIMLFGSGYKTTDLAKHFNVHRTTITLIKHRLNLL